MKRMLLSLAGTAVFLMGCATASGDRLNENSLIGEWSCISATVDGKALPKTTVASLRLHLTGNRYVTTKGAETLFDSSYRVDRTAKPNQIFMLGNEGDLASKEASGIFLIEGDSFTISYTMPGDPRPTAFESKPGSKVYLIEWRRNK